jgi:hypothetical protein
MTTTLQLTAENLQRIAAVDDLFALDAIGIEICELHRGGWITSHDLRLLYAAERERRELIATS